MGKVKIAIIQFFTDAIQGSFEKKRHYWGKISDIILAYTKLNYILIKGISFFLPLNILWQWTISPLDNKENLQLWRHSNKDRVPRIIIFGTGSIGDLLQATPLIRVLRNLFPTAEICFLHRSIHAKTILGHNPYLNSVSWANFVVAQRLDFLLFRAGFADLMIEIESGSYCCSCSFAPASSCHPFITDYFSNIKREEMSKALQKLKNLPNFQNQQGNFIWNKEWKKLHFLDIMGQTTGLPLNRYETLDFFPQGDLSQFPEIPLAKSYVTIHNSVDEAVYGWAKITKKYPTKLLPLRTCQEIVQKLRSKGLFVIQLGTATDQLIPGISLDLRGKTTIDQAALIIQNSLYQVGNEGGLVHLARAMKTLSHVFFGPTSESYLAYPDHKSYSSGSCRGCWRSVKTWYIRCLHDDKNSRCMKDHRGEQLF
jgi:ADP-heptose:LPS heptosyltransferase